MKTLIPQLIPVLLASFSLNVIAATTHYVDLNSPNPSPPYTSWLTAATNIQNAIDAAVAGDEIVVYNERSLSNWRQGGAWRHDESGRSGHALERSKC